MEEDVKFKGLGCLRGCLEPRKYLDPTEHTALGCIRALRVEGVAVCISICTCIYVYIHVYVQAFTVLGAPVYP